MPVGSMQVRRIILAGGISLAAAHATMGQPMLPTPQPVVTQPVPTGAAPVVIDGQPNSQAAPIMVQPMPQPTVVYPPGSTFVPLPSQTPGSIFGPPMPPTAAAVQPPGMIVPEQLPTPPGTVALPGQVPGAVSNQGIPAVVPGPGAVAGPANPISVPVVDDDLAWDQIADVVSDYFRIAREQRARRGGEGGCEGRIDTIPRDGATWLEPWRQDSVGVFNRWESTFQSIRRRATVRVIPDVNGYLVEVIVEKELEDLPRPEKATAGAAAFSTDITLPSNRLEEVSRLRSSPRWISLGRDPALEQRMLAEIHARLNGVTSRGSVFATASRASARSAAKR